jgi:hypothetical protein
MKKIEKLCSPFFHRVAEKGLGFEEELGHVGQLPVPVMPDPDDAADFRRLRAAVETKSYHVF